MPKPTALVGASELPPGVLGDGTVTRTAEGFVFDEVSAAERAVARARVDVARAADDPAVWDALETMLPALAYAPFAAFADLDAPTGDSLFPTLREALAAVDDARRELGDLADAGRARLAEMHADEAAAERAAIDWLMGSKKGKEPTPFHRSAWLAVLRQVHAEAVARVQALDRVVQRADALLQAVAHAPETRERIVAALTQKAEDGRRYAAALADAYVQEGLFELLCAADGLDGEGRQLRVNGLSNSTAYGLRRGRRVNDPLAANLADYFLTPDALAWLTEAGPEAPDRTSPAKPTAAGF